MYHSQMKSHNSSYFISLHSAKSSNHAHKLIPELTTTVYVRDNFWPESSFLHRFFVIENSECSGEGSGESAHFLCNRIRTNI